jgi:hypothetical protein
MRWIFAVANQALAVLPTPALRIVLAPSDLGFAQIAVLRYCFDWLSFAHDCPPIFLSVVHIRGTANLTN